MNKIFVTGSMQAIFSELVQVLLTGAFFSMSVAHKQVAVVCEHLQRMYWIKTCEHEQITREHYYKCYMQLQVCTRWEHL